MLLCALLVVGLTGSTSSAKAASPALASEWQEAAANAVAGPYRGLFETPPVTVRVPVALAETFAPSPARVQEQPPPVRHTGLAALIRTTGADFKAFPRRRSTWVILGIGAGSALAAHPFDDDVKDGFQSAGPGVGHFFATGKYLGLGMVQAGAAIGTYVVGRYVIHPAQGQTNKISHVGFDLLRANIITQAFTYGIKYAVRRDRPDGTCCAFPSGHASVTFATASVLERHFGYRASWPTFAIAGYVAASRLHENKHFLSDVLFGSALGMATGWTVVGRHGREHFALLPYPMRGGVGISAAWTPEGVHAGEH